jgi:pimeloyl-ACP methyl ester carboxylesterase
MVIFHSAIHKRGYDRPPVVLVHGAANSASVWTFWKRELSRQGWPPYAIELRGHGPTVYQDGPIPDVDLSRVSMADYADDVRLLSERLEQRPVVIGWSMGGLVAMMVAPSGHADACVALAPSLPARRPDPSVELRAGEFGPEEYGITSYNPEHQPAMPDLDLEERIVAVSSLGRESRFARDERRRGIVVESLPCPLLIVTGTLDRQWPAERYDGLWLPSDRLSVEGASHWGLVLNRRALARMIPAVLQWLVDATAASPPPRT